MAIYNTPDGRQVVGSVESGNDYHGFNGKRDIIIQLTADGATTDGLNALEYLKAYAIEQNKQNKPIFPNGTRVFISANGFTKAVEADDIVIDGDNITIGGIKWDGSAWDYTNAGQPGGSGGGDDVIFEYVQGVLNCNKTPQEIAGLVGKHVNVYFYNSNSQYIATSYTINLNNDKTAASIFALFITRDMYNANKYQTAFILQSAQGAASVTWKSYTLTPDA